AVPCGFERARNGTARGANRGADLARVRPSWRIVVDAEVVGENPVFGPFISRRSVRQKLLGEAIHACLPAVILGGSTWNEVRSKLCQAFRPFADFAPDAVAHSSEVAELQPGNAEQLANGVNAHAIEDGVRLDAIPNLSDAAGAVETAGNQLDTVGG